MDDPVQYSFFVGPTPFYQLWGETAVALLALVGVLLTLRRARPDAWTLVAIVAAVAFAATAGIESIAYSGEWPRLSSHLLPWYMEHYGPIYVVRIASIAVLVVALLARRRPRRAAPVVIDKSGAAADPS